MKSLNINNSLHKDLKDMSVFLGNNIDWIQGAGGNTSVKCNDILWVKASGCWLSDAHCKDIFTPLKRQLVLDKIDQEIEDLSSAQLFQEKNQILRPSIETTLHALMPHKFVAHVHSVNVISYAVLNHSKKILNNKLKGINWMWVPYVRPGLPLTIKLNQMNMSNFDVVIFANHGVVIGGESKDEVLDIFNNVEARLRRPVRDNSLETNKIKLANIVNSSLYKLPKYDLAHSLAMDNLSLEVISKNALYPDHVIFLGPGPIPIMSYEQFMDKLFQDSLDFNHKVIVIKDIGVVVNQNLSLNAEEMLHCLANVTLRLEPGDELKHLTQSQESELLGWDAEKYRKLIQR